MHLLEIEARNWRGLSRTLDDLSPQLNVISGPNECGKSRLFQALRYGLFEPTKGASAHKAQLQSWSGSDSPFVRVSFQHEGAAYEIQKQFLKGHSAILKGNGATYKNDEAEEMLRSLMGSRHVGAKRAGNEDLGIWPLLMVEQGHSRVALGDHMNTEGRSQLQYRLSREIDVAAISDAGHKVMELAEQEYRRFYTATGRDSGQLSEARAEHAAAKSAHEDATASYARQERTATDLAAARKTSEGLTTRFRSLKGESEAALEKANLAQAAESRLTAARGKHEAAEERVKGTQQALLTRQEADVAIARLAKEVTERKALIEARALQEPGLIESADDAERGVNRAQATVTQAKATQEIARREQRRIELTRQRTDLANKAESLEKIEASLIAARETHAGLPLIDAEILSNLRKLEQAASSAAAQLKGAAVSVAITLRRDITIDGIARFTGERVQIDVIDNRDIAIGDVAQVEVRPGRGSLDKVRDLSADADTAYGAALSKAGFDSLEAASNALTAIQISMQHLSELTVSAQATSAQPLTELREELIRLDGELQRLGPAKTIEGTEQQLQVTVESAEEALQSARTAREVANDSLKDFQRESSTLRSRQDGTQSELDHLTGLYEGRDTAEQLQARLQNERAARDDSAAAIRDADRDFHSLGGADAQRDAKRLTSALEGMQRQMSESQSAVDKLHGSLLNLMGEGGYDLLQQAESRLELATSALARIERQAKTAARLWTMLQEERRSVVERLTAPVITRIKPYLASLFPGSTLDAGADLNFEGLRTGDTQEPFDDLSGGAQEQLTLLTRLGIAEVLAGDGTLPILLDDALVNSDPERIQRIHRALYKAAEKLQVILFTCHDVLFDALGAHRTIRLVRGAR